MNTWHHPLPLRLIPTNDGDSFRKMPGDATALPVAPHPAAFGVKRKHHTHEGVDLYVPVNTPVMAVEDGIVVSVAPFTGPQAGLPWWLDTSAVFVEGATGVVVYGEIEPCVKVGDELIAGQILGKVLRVLAKDKGRPTAMLHLELHKHGSRAAPEWLDHDAKPDVLCDPTPHLATCLRVQAPFNRMVNADEAAAIESLAARFPEVGLSLVQPLLRNTFDYNPFTTGNPEALGLMIVGMLPADENSFLSSRRRYLCGLPSIGFGWIAGGGVVEGESPSVEVCSKASGLLSYLGTQKGLENDWTPSSIILGPIPAGGVTMELRLASLGAEVTIHFYNDQDAELAFKTADGYIELSAPASDVQAVLVANLGLQP